MLKFESLIKYYKNFVGPRKFRAALPQYTRKSTSGEG